MNKADIYFKNNIRKILEFGTWDEDPRPRYKSDGAPAFSKYITMVNEEYDLSKGQFPITTLRPIAFDNGIKETQWIYQDQTNSLEVLEQKYGIMWWRDWEVKFDYESTEEIMAELGLYPPAEGTIGQRYGATVKRYDMMNRLLKGLKENPFGRRNIINLLQEADLQETPGLVPCAFQIMLTPRRMPDGLYLDMSLTQRGSDYLVAGHINKMQYVALQMMVAHEVGMKIGKFGHYVQNLHIYERHLEQAEELLRRPTAHHEAKFILNAEGKSFYEIEARDFQLLDYNPTKPQLKFDLGI